MNWTIYFGLAVLVVAAGWLLHRWWQRRLSPAELEARIQPVDLACFQALQRSFDARCLQALPAAQKRAIRRRLAWAAWDYIRRVHSNASIYAVLGQRAAHAPDVQLATAGRELAHMAIMARLQASHALYRTALMLAFPGPEISAAWVPLYRAVEKPFAHLHALSAAQAA